jgi:hypothetical protein
MTRSAFPRAGLEYCIHSLSPRVDEATAMRAASGLLPNRTERSTGLQSCMRRGSPRQANCHVLLPQILVHAQGVRVATTIRSPLSETSKGVPS